jgi:hypothetical protein
MADLTSPIPSDAPIVGTARDPSSGKERISKYMSEDFNNWLLELTTRLNASPESVGDSISVSASAASIASTAAFVPLGAGMFRVSYYVRVVQAGTVSSSIQVSIGSTDEGISCTQSSAAATGNTTATVLSGSFVVRSDQAAAITYATTYASVGATAMNYDLIVTVEQIPT